MMALLSCQNLSVGYEGKPVLQNLSFEIFAGDYLCIVGENGSGKTTLMKTLLGLQPPIGGRPATKRNRLSAPANPGAAGLPGLRKGDRSLRLPGPLRPAALL